LIEVKVKQMRDGRHPLPKYATVGSAAMDFYAYIGEGSITLRPMEQALIPLGIGMNIPNGYELRLSPRSGLALKHGVTLTNSPGLIDEDYCGEIGAIVLNLGRDDVVITDGTRICQGGFYEYKKARLVEVSDLDKTDRGAGGFGSTGA
jgi:dUTP pyrophosphatase